MHKLMIAILAMLPFMAASAEITIKEQAHPLLALAEDAFLDMLESYDSNTDGTVYIDEYIDENFKLLLKHDVNNNKEISAQEYLAAEDTRIEKLMKENPKATEPLKQTQKMSRQTLPLIYQTFDIDKNDNLSEEEFNPLFQIAFQQSDVNKDGKIDMTDLDLTLQTLKTQLTQE